MRAWLNSTLVTMCVVVPHIRCILIQSCQCSSLPYFTSNQRTRRVVEKPELISRELCLQRFERQRALSNQVFQIRVSDSIFR